MASPKEIFTQVYEEAKVDPKILGFFLAGSRGKGRPKEHSDYDTYIIVEDDVVQEYKVKYPFRKYEGVDLIVIGFTEFKKMCFWGSGDEFGRYTFTHVKALLDKNGQIQKIIDEKGRIPAEEVSKFIPLAIDAYVNFFYRSLKCIRDGDLPAARLEAAYAIPPFLNVIFAIHGGRLSPYYKYLRWELEEFPLDKFPISPSELIDDLMLILETADCKTQQKLMRVTEDICRKEGYGFQFDTWEGDYVWMMDFRPDLQ